MRLNRTAVARIIIGLGYLALLAGVLSDWPLSGGDVQAIGLGTLVGAVAWIALATRRDDEAIYETGRQAGYDAGFIDGRRIARPVIVPMPELRLIRETAGTRRDRPENV